MGVKGLWKILEPVKEVVHLESLRSKVLGIDLAVWVVQAETVTNGEVRGLYLRNLFYKVSHLLELGVGIVVVTDGKAPVLKAQTIADRLGVNLDRNSKVIQRRRFIKMMRECEELLTSLGIPVLRGEAEGEASAAKLQLEGKINGVITTDGDAFLYGARQVYRNVLVTEKYCELYNMDRVEYELGLCRDDLIGLAILNGCDYQPEGITGLGKQTVLDYIQSRERLRSVTEELLSWNAQSAEIIAKYEQLMSITSKPHCGTCKHVGSKKEHLLSGCGICGTEAGVPCTTTTLTPCTCSKHVAKRLLASPHMQCCVKFTRESSCRRVPVKEIIQEFQNYTTITDISLSWQMEQCDRFVYFMYDKLQWRKISGAEKFAYVASLHYISQAIDYQMPYLLGENDILKFNHILKERTKDKIPMYELEFQVVNKELKKILEFDVVYSILNAEFVALLMPDAVKEFKNRQHKMIRKKKEVIPIYDRYPVKPKPTYESPKPVVYKSPKKGGPKNAQRPKTARSRKPPSKLEALPTDLENLDINSKSYSSDDSDDVLPLAERLALRKASVNSASTLSLGTEPTVSKTSVSKSLSSSSLSSAGLLEEDRKRSDVIIPNGNKEPIILALDVVSDTGDYDSNIQLLPQDFMDDYLDLSREEILGISSASLGDDFQSGNGNVLLEEHPDIGDHENSFVVSESVNSDDYQLQFSEETYHQIAFVTPLKPTEIQSPEKNNMLTAASDMTLGTVTPDPSLLQSDRLQAPSPGITATSSPESTEVKESTYLENILSTGIHIGDDGSLQLILEDNMKLEFDDSDLLLNVSHSLQSVTNSEVIPTEVEKVDTQINAVTGKPEDYGKDDAVIDDSTIETAEYGQSSPKDVPNITSSHSNNLSTDSLASPDQSSFIKEEDLSIENISKPDHVFPSNTLEMDLSIDEAGFTEKQRDTFQSTDLSIDMTVAPGRSTDHIVLPGIGEGIAPEEIFSPALSVNISEHRLSFSPTSPLAPISSSIEHIPPNISSNLSSNLTSNLDSHNGNNSIAATLENSLETQKSVERQLIFDDTVELEIKNDANDAIALIPENEQQTSQTDMITLPTDTDNKTPLIISDNLGTFENPIAIPDEDENPIIPENVLSDFSSVSKVPDLRAYNVDHTPGTILDVSLRKPLMPVPPVKTNEAKLGDLIMKSPLPDVPMKCPLPDVPHSPIVIPDFSPAPPLNHNPVQTPDTSFLEPRLEIDTPVWHRPPLSDITNVTSTPNPKQGGVDVAGVESATKDPLPDILPRDNFNVNITELLEESNATNAD